MPAGRVHAAKSLPSCITYWFRLSGRHRFVMVAIHLRLIRSSSISSSFIDQRPAAVTVSGEHEHRLLTVGQVPPTSMQLDVLRDAHKNLRRPV